MFGVLIIRILPFRPKIGGTLFGVLIIRILLFRVLCWGPLFLEARGFGAQEFRAWGLGFKGLGSGFLRLEA